MTTPNPSQNRPDWQASLGHTPDCLGPDRLSAALTDDETEHVAGCARCQAERGLWVAFRDSHPGDDQAVVADVAAELRRRLHAGTVAGNVMSATPLARPRMPTIPSWLRMAALLALATTVGYGLWDREPALRSPGPEAPVYRSTSIETVAPHGDLSVAPAVFAWLPLDGAVRYNVRVREVDGAEFWSASSTEPRLSIPPNVQRRMVTGKTLIWDVAGVTDRGDLVARSIGQRFRVGGQPPFSGE